MPFVHSSLSDELSESIIMLFCVKCRKSNIGATNLSRWQTKTMYFNKPLEISLNNTIFIIALPCSRYYSIKSKYNCKLYCPLIPNYIVIRTTYIYICFKRSLHIKRNKRTYLENSSSRKEILNYEITKLFLLPIISFRLQCKISSQSTTTTI